MEFIRAITVTSELTVFLCNQTSDAAYVIAFRIGRSDGLCEEDGLFLSAFEECETCVEEQISDEDEDVTARDFINPDFDRFLIFCDVGLIFTTVTHILTDGSRATTTLLIGVGGSPTGQDNSTVQSTTTSSTWNYPEQPVT